MTTTLVGTSQSIHRLRHSLDAVARTNSTVLITGETGTGKGLVARAIHERSQRASGPFIHVDCASLAESVIESELFGHERGAFTGAHERRPGRFELAERGTIFLDEIGEIDSRVQAKLLRVLQDREYERVGGGRTLRMTARVIAATNQHLEQAVRRQRFRADLYFRLNVFSIALAPLRARQEDIPLLVDHALVDLAEKLDVPVPDVDDSLIAVLQSHDWPGNVRELLNVLERALVLASGDGCLDGSTVLPLLAQSREAYQECPLPESLDPVVGSAPVETTPAWRGPDDVLQNFRSWLKQQERHYMTELTRRFPTTRERAAVSGLPERTLYRKLRELS